MKKTITLAVLLGLITSLFAGKPPSTYAQEFSQAYIRLDRTASSFSPLPVLVVATTGSSSTEDEIRLTVSSAWSISDTAGDFTVTTTGLPSGVSAWPGIGTATGVAGQAITFPSGDLSPGTQYGFFITGGIGTNPAEGVYGWTLASRSGGSQDSSTDLFISIEASDQISATGTVPQQADDFQVDMASLTSGEPFPQNTDIEYQITYGSYLKQSTDLDLVAEWTKGTIDGSSTPTVEVVEYKVGSAFDAYNSTPPVIDTVNRKITWSIDSFPAETTDQTVEFTLTTTDNYQGDSLVYFDISARIETDDVTTPDDTITQSYQFDTPLEPTATPMITPTPTPGPSATPTPGPSATPEPGPTATPTATPSPTPSPTPTAVVPPTTPAPHIPLAITRVKILEITDSSVQILIETSAPTTYRLSYGTTLNTLEKALSGTELNSRHIIDIGGLEKNTRYYFKFTVTDERERTAESDIFTFQTAAEKEDFLVEEVSVLADNTILNHQQHSNVLLPTAKPATIIIQLSNAEKISDLLGRFVHQQVLGINTQHSPVNFGDTAFVATSPDKFSGQLSAPVRQGQYHFRLTLTSESGGLYNHILPVNFYIAPPLSVVNSKNQKPIENADIEFLLFEEYKQQYTALTRAFSLPVHTDAQGISDIAFPTGKYRLRVSSIGYAEVRFAFAPGIDDFAYPKVELEPRFSLTAYIRYISSSFTDSLKFALRTVNTFFSSSRARDAFAVTSLLGLFLLAILFFLLRHHKKIIAHGRIREALWWTEHNLFIMLSDLIILVNLSATILFTLYHGWRDSLLLLILSLLIFVIWLLFEKQLWRTEN